MKHNNLFEALEAVLKRYKYDFEDSNMDVLYLGAFDHEPEYRVDKEGFKEVLLNTPVTKEHKLFEEGLWIFEEGLGMFGYHQRGEKQVLTPLLIWYDQDKEGWVLRPRLEKVNFNEKQNRVYSGRRDYIMDSERDIRISIDESKYRYQCRTEHREPYPDDLAGYDEEYESYDI